MRKRKWSKKQQRVVSLARNPNPFILAYGASGAGKTDAGTAGFITWSLQFKGATFALVAKTAMQTKEKVWIAARRFCEEHRIPYSSPKGKAASIGHNRFVLLDGANVAAADRIQGLDLAGVYIDEVNNLHPQVMQELENRVRSVENGKIVMSANPDNPLSWFQKNYVNKADEIGMDIIKLLWPDNPGLPESEKRRMEATATAAMLRRRKYGEAAPLRGVIYTDYDIAPAPPDKDAWSWYLSVDPAFSSTTHALLFGKFKNEYWVTDEWVWDSHSSYSKTSQETCNEIADWLGDKSVTYAIYDPAASEFGYTLMQTLQCPTYAAEKDVMEGIQTTAAYLADGRVRIDPRCDKLIYELANYHWDPAAGERGEDKPAKTDDHGCDALRYFLHSTHLRW